MDTEKKIMEREPARHVYIKTILDAKYVMEEGWMPNYMMSGDLKISRVNVIGSVVTKEMDPATQLTFLYIDDGSGRILVRDFEPRKDLPKMEVGQAVMVIGKPREFNTEKYIVPEIVRLITDPAWIKLRQIELGELPRNVEPLVPPSQEKISPPPDESNWTDRMIDLIRELDSGEGAAVDEVLKKAQFSDTEKKIEILIKQGEIFEAKPGRLKVL